jgi:hypothetical protein
MSRSGTDHYTFCTRTGAGKEPIITPSVPEQEPVPIITPSVSEQEPIRNWSLLLLYLNRSRSGTDHYTFSTRTGAEQEPIRNRSSLFLYPNRSRSGTDHYTFCTRTGADKEPIITPSVPKLEPETITTPSVPEKEPVRNRSLHLLYPNRSR